MHTSGGRAPLAFSHIGGRLGEDHEPPGPRLQARVCVIFSRATTVASVVQKGINLITSYCLTVAVIVARRRQLFQLSCHCTDLFPFILSLPCGGHGHLSGARSANGHAGQDKSDFPPWPTVPFLQNRTARVQEQERATAPSRQCIDRERGSNRKTEKGSCARLSSRTRSISGLGGRRRRHYSVGASDDVLLHAAEHVLRWFARVGVYFRFCLSLARIVPTVHLLSVVPTLRTYTDSGWAPDCGLIYIYDTFIGLEHLLCFGVRSLEHTAVVRRLA